MSDASILASDPGEAAQGIRTGDLLCLAISRFGDRVAMIDDSHSLTYRQLGRAIFSLARALGSRGISRGDGVVTLMPNVIEAFVVRMAVQMIGARFTALNVRSSAADHAFIIDDCEARAFVYHPSLAQAAQAATQSLDVPSYCLGHGQDADIASIAQTCPDDMFRPVGLESDIARIAYTGGTTGFPKGVVLAHRATVQNVMMVLAEYDLPPQPRMLLPMPLSHAAGSLVLPVLLRGGTVRVTAKFDPEHTCAIISREHITAILGVPTMIYSLLDLPSLRREDFAGLSTFIYGSAPVAAAKVAEAIERIGPVFMQNYAQTEAPNTVCILRKEEHDLTVPQRLESCGRPMAGVEVAILDPDNQPVPTGQLGEICVRSRLVMDGYWKRPDATAETLRGGWLHTGDVARLGEDGYIFIVDRAKDMIISGGFNVYPREIEDAIETHPGVAIAAVVGVPHDHWGEVPKAFVVRRDSEDVSHEEIVALVRNLKGAIQIPKSIEFVESLPLTPAGKVDKKALKTPHWNNGERKVG